MPRSIGNLATSCPLLLLVSSERCREILKDYRYTLSEEIRYLRQALLSRRLALFLLLALLGITLAYQVKRPILIDIGGPHDCPYLGTSEYCPQSPDWHDRETNRWSKGRSPIYLPGIGSQPYNVTLRLTGARPGLLEPPPLITVTVSGREYTWQTEPNFTEKTFPLPRLSAIYSSVDLLISTPTFTPPNDARELGVNVDWVRVDPADPSLFAPVIPSISVTLYLLGSLLLLYLLAYRTFRSHVAALAVGVPLLLVLLVLLALRRLEITTFALQLFVALFWSLLLAYLLLILAGSRYEDSKRGLQPIPILAGIFALAFALRFGGMTHPQFISSDLTFHAHRIDYILDFFAGREANFFFEGELPNGLKVPYPSAFYILLAPFQALLGGATETGKLLLRFSSALLDAVVVLMVYRIAWRLGMVAALSAAALYAFGPAPFQLFSAGNHSNIFAQTMLVGAITCLVEVLSKAQDEKGYRAWLTGYLIFSALTLLGHYGVAISSVVITGAVVFLWHIFTRGETRGRIWPIVGAFAAALLVSYLLYYVQFNEQIAEQARSLLNGGGKSSRGWDVPRLLLDILKWQGWVILPLAALGGVLLYRRRNANSQSQATDPRPPTPNPLYLVLSGWLLASVPLAATALFDRDTIRYNLLMLPALCILAGFALQWLAGRLPVLSLGKARIRPWPAFMGLALLYTLIIWGDLVYNQYH